MCLPNILFPVFMFAFIFHCRSFSPCWPLAFLIFSPPLWISMFFFLRNSSPLFSITRSSSFSVIHVSVNIKNNAEKDTTLLLFFLFKSPGGLHLGCHTCWLSYFTLVCMWCGRMVGWSVMTKFSRRVDYHISLAMGLRYNFPIVCCFILGDPQKGKRHTWSQVRDTEGEAKSKRMGKNGAKGWRIWTAPSISCSLEFLSTS